MAYRKPHTMDEFAKVCVKGDTRLRQTVGADLVAYLADLDNPIECEDIGEFVDALVQWTQSSNFKVTQNALEALTHICDRLRQDFWPYVPTVLPHVIDRLGDQKESVREKAQLLILKILERHVIQPQHLFDKLSEGFTHKNGKIREEVLRCIINILNEYGIQNVTVSKLTPNIAKLLSDPIPSVRDTAINAFVEIYKHVGDKLSLDLQKKNYVPPGKLPMLLQKFNEIKENGELLPTAVAACPDFDEPDRIVKPTKPVKRTISAPATKRPGNMAAGQAGAVDEESFLNAMEDVPQLLALSAKDCSAIALSNIKDIIGDKDMLWTKRVDNLKKIRSLLLAGAASYDDFAQNVRNLAQSLAVAATDGRSQVSREACVTIAYLSQQLGNKFDKTANLLLPYLIGLVQNSAKVIATAGALALRHVLTYTQSPPLIPIVTQHATTSKSKEIRRTCYEMVSHIIQTWQPTTALEKQVPNLADAIKKGIADADNDSRKISRKAFWSFREVYSDAADVLLRSLEPTYHRMLMTSAGLGDHMSSSSSSSSLNQVSGHNVMPTRSTASSADTPRAGLRSYTAIDLQAAQRAKARTQYAALARQKIASGTASLPRPKKINTKSTAVTTTMERPGRARSRPLGGSISQPTSRSVSPSLKMSYATYGRFGGGGGDTEVTPRARKLSNSGIPRSTSVSRDHSRETSPTRGSRIGYPSLSYRGGSGPGSLRSTPNRDHRPPISPHRPPVMAQKILQQSREAETALAAALQTDSLDTSDYLKSIGGRKLNRSLDNPSDDSEASSVCSERSYDSFRRDSYSFSGSHTRLSRDHWDQLPKDINEIIKLCASATWTERKEGLIGLHTFLAERNTLTSSQLKKVTEIFPKMFMDSNTKVVSLFLDTLNELLIVHHKELHDWLYMLLQRIFNKLGIELLVSIYKKIEKTLDVIRENFPIDLQFQSVFRYLTDHTQRPNSKVKITILVYIIHLSRMTNSLMIENKALLSQGLEKIISFTEDKKSAEVQNVARNCLISLFNCNTSQFTKLLTTLPCDQQDIASEVLQSLNLRKTSSSGTNSPLKSPISHENFSREDIHRSLRHTTAEIQNYSFDSLGGGQGVTHLERDSTSQDSGISQMSTGNSGSVIAKNNGSVNHIAKLNAAPISIGTNGDHVSANDDISISEKDIIRQIGELDNNPELPEAEVIKIFTQVGLAIQANRVKALTEHFRLVLKVLLWHLERSNENIQCTILNVFTYMFNCDDMKKYYENFVQLLTLKILQSHGSSSKEVCRHAEKAAAAMTKCPLSTMIQIINPSIMTETSPQLIEGILKMLTNIIKVNGATQLNTDLVDLIVPNLIKAYNHTDSSIRKCAVFCIVAIYSAVGEEVMKPYLEKLSGSKLKLLHVYIQRAQTQTTSSKN